STTMNTALIDSYVGEPADLSPNSAISWDVTALRPGGGTWSWADNFSTVTVDVNPSKSSSADEKNFYLDAVGLRVTTDQNCDAGTSTTLSPVPLQDSYDPASVDFVSASPTPTSVNTATGIIQWADVGPILPGSTASVAVTMRARNITGTRTGTCGVSAPPTSTSACNWAECRFGSRHVYYADGRLANDASSKIAIAMQGKNEVHGALWKDTNADGWAYDAGEPFLPNITVTLWGCVQSDGVTMETSAPNKTCTAATSGNFWKKIATDITDSNGAYDFIGLDTGYYLVEVGDNDNAPAVGNSSPFSGTPPTLLHKVWTETVESTGGTGSLNNQIPMTVTAGQVSGSHDFGYTQVDASDIGDYLYYDFDGDGIFDSGESGIPNVTVWLYEDIDRDGTIDAGVDSIVATTASDSTGHYLFSNFPAGSYIVKVDTTDPDFPTDVLASGDPDLSAASIGDTIYYDLNASGTQTAGEDGIPLVIVNLY